MDARIDVDAAEAKAAEIVSLAGEVDIFVFGLRGPIAADGVFETEARGPSGLVVANREQRRDTVGIVDVDMRVSPGDAAGDVRHEPVEGIADAAAHRADIVERGVEGHRRTRQCRAVKRPRERRIGFDAEHDAVGELAVVAELIAAAEPGCAVRQDDALLGQRIGAGSEARVAVAEMAADIEAGPLVDGFRGARLQRQVGSDAGTRQHEHARGNCRGRPQIAMSVTSQRQNYAPKTRLCPNRARHPCQFAVLLSSGSWLFTRSDETSSFRCASPQDRAKSLRSLRTLLQVIRNSN